MGAEINWLGQNFWNFQKRINGSKILAKFLENLKIVIITVVIVIIIIIDFLNFPSPFSNPF